MMAQDTLYDLVIQDDVLDVELVPVHDDAEVAHASALELAHVEFSPNPMCMAMEDEDDDAPVFSALAVNNEAHERWLQAPEAAKALGISARRLRKLAAIGKIDRRRDDGRCLYLVPGLSEALTLDRSANEDTQSGRSSAFNPQTQPGLSIAARLRSCKKESSIHDEKTVIVSAEEIEYVESDIVPSALMSTNRELMRLVDVVLGNWSSVANQRTVSSAQIQRALAYSLELQHCLGEWQQHAQKLERMHMESAHTASRALDIAEEVLASRWCSSKRRQTLADRVNELRARL